LAAAMLAFEGSGPPEGAGISTERVDSLLGELGHWRLPFWCSAASLLVLSCLAALIWRSSEVASTHASFNLPLLSSQPCLAVLTLLALLVCLVTLPRRAWGGHVGRKLHVAMTH
jgi:hypothetical protein